MILAALAALVLSLPAAPVLADLEAAHRFWRTGTAFAEPADAQGVCRGRWNVIADATLPDRGLQGVATGIGFTYNPISGPYTDANGNRWDWHVERCEFMLNPALQGGERRCFVAHEVGHFIFGPWHIGLMSSDTMGRCVALAYELERQIRIDAEIAARLSASARARSLARRACRRGVAPRGSHRASRGSAGTRGSRGSANHRRRDATARHRRACARRARAQPRS